MNDPGKDVDVYFTSSVQTMADIWMGENSYRKAMGAGDLTVVGNKALTRNITSWMANDIKGVGDKTQSLSFVTDPFNIL